MEAKCLSEPQQMSFDIVTALPQPIIEIILCLLPIEEAARTSILSRDWRYKWTTIPKLVFHMVTVCSRTRKETQTSYLAGEIKNMDVWGKLFYAIHQVLLLRQGPIHEFSLSMGADDHYFEIDQIILHLSRNHPLKKLTLELDESFYYTLPICAFSLHQLTDLHLTYIDLDDEPIFNGFGNLRTLCLFDVIISRKALLHLLSNCPSLTSFTLNNSELIDDIDCPVIELFECLPLIEHLCIHLGNFLEMFVLASKELPTSLIHLKYLCLRDMCLVEDKLRFLLVLIKCSPNLEKLKINEFGFYPSYKDFTSSRVFEDYSDVWLEHLKELEIECVEVVKHDINFVKFISARSPKLKKVQISSMCYTDPQKWDI